MAEKSIKEPGPLFRYKLVLFFSMRNIFCAGYCACFPVDHQTGHTSQTGSGQDLRGGTELASECGDLVWHTNGFWAEVSTRDPLNDGRSHSDYIRQGVLSLSVLSLSP